MKKLRVLNCYCGIGGNRKKWKNVEVTAIENNPEIAKIYQDFFPEDKIIITDAHEYLLKHYKEFDFIWSSPPCFIGKELVLTMRGHIPIKNVRIGDKVLTHKGRWKKVIKIGRKKVNVIRKLKGIGVDSIKCTSNHPFYVKDALTNNKISYWNEAKSIVGKYWCSHTTIEPIEHFCLLEPYIIGRWLGDGWLRKQEGKKTVLICCGKYETIDELKGWIKSEERTTYRYSLHDSNAVDFLYNNFKDKHNKLLPGWVFGKPKEFREQLLKGYLDADGHFEKKRKRWVVTSVSRSLIYAIELLTQSLGYRCNVSKPKIPDTHIIEGRIVNQKQKWILSIKKREEDKPRQYLIEDKEYSKVKSNKSFGWNADVYDIQVEGDESYTVNNKIVHNCQSHSSFRKNICVNFRETEAKYPEMNLYQEILFLQSHFKGKWVIENVKPYYKPLIPAKEIQRHLFWSNFPLHANKFLKEDNIRKVQIPDLQKLHGFNLEKYKLKNKRQILRNCVLPELGIHIFNCAFKDKQKRLK